MRGPRAAFFMLCLLFGLACKDALDLIPPSVKILTPPDNAKIVGQVQVVVVATDAHLKQILAYLDGSLIGQSASETLSCVCYVPDSLHHTIRAKATDYRGNFGLASATVNPVSDIEVRSTPTKAEVWLDGRNTGKNSNCLLSDVPTGPHILKLTLSGYRDWQDTVTVSLGVTRSRQATLTPSPYPDSVVATIGVGYGPVALAWNATGNKLYCANEVSDNVSIIDCATNSVVATVGVGSSPCALTWNATNNLVYSANNMSDDVTVIDGAYNYVTTISTGQEPTALTWDGTDNKVYVANWLDYTLTVIDGTTNQVRNTFEVPDRPVSLAWDRADDRVYCACEGTLAVIDGATDRVESQVGLPANSLAWYDDADVLYCGSSVEAVITAINCKNNSIITNISSGLSGLLASLVCDQINWKIYCGYFGDSYQDMEIIDCHSNSVVEKQRGLSYNTLGLAFNSTQNRVYVCQKGDGAAPGDVVVLGAP